MSKDKTNQIIILVGFIIIVGYLLMPKYKFLTGGLNTTSVFSCNLVTGFCRAFRLNDLYKDKVEY